MNAAKFVEGVLATLLFSAAGKGSNRQQVLPRATEAVVELCAVLVSAY